MLDIALLKILKHRKDFYKLNFNVPHNAIDPKTKAIIEDFGKFFEKFPEHETIDSALFIPRFRQWHPHLTEEQFNAFVGMLRQIDENVDESTKNGIVADLCELRLATHLANLAAKFDAGELKLPLSDLVSAEIDAYKIAAGIKLTQWNEKTIEELLQEDIDERGVRWRLNTLNNCMRPLRPGDFGIVAGRPDKGKTTFLSSELTFMANQLPEDRNILWLNNEGPGDRVKKRLFQSALGTTISELVRCVDEKKDIMAAYAHVIGRRDRIRVIDIHGFHIGQVEAILEVNNPGIVCFDMIDNIKGFGSEPRTDLALEEMYKWARERCVKYECIGIASSQISNEGDGEQYPTLGMLKDSKTGKQGACDFQLMIGASNDPNLTYSRYISLPKNKLRREDAPGDPHAEVQFKPSIARFEDLPYGS